MFLIQLWLLCLFMSVYAADLPKTTGSLIEKNVYTTRKPETKEEPQTTRLKEILNQAAELLQKQEQKSIIAQPDRKLSGIMVNLLGEGATEPLACPIEFARNYFGT